MLALIITLINDGSEAISALEAFLATPAGKDLEAKLASLFTVTTTPAGAVIIEPSITPSAQREALQNAGKVR